MTPVPFSSGKRAVKSAASSRKVALKLLQKPRPKLIEIAPVSRTLKKPKSSKPQKAIFKELTLSIAGNITNTSGTHIAHEDIARWFTVHGGLYESEVTQDTTHLICSIEEYKKRGPQGKFKSSLETPA